MIHFRGVDQFRGCSGSSAANETTLPSGAAVFSVATGACPPSSTIPAADSLGSGSFVSRDLAGIVYREESGSPGVMIVECRVQEGQSLCGHGP